MAASSGVRLGIPDAKSGESSAGSDTAVTQGGPAQVVAAANDGELFERSPEAILIATAEGRFLDANPAALALLGYEREELLGLRLEDVFAPEPGSTFGDSALGIEQTQCEGEVMLPAQDGMPVVAEARTFLVRRPGSDTHVTVLRDLTKPRRNTEYARLEQALRASETHFSTAFEHAAIGMSLVGLDGRWLKVNRALCQLTGYSEEELLATRFHDITHPDDLEPDLAHIDDLLAGNTHSFQMEKRYFRKDGSIVWVILSVSLLRDDSGAPLHFISQVQDISERKSVEVERAVTHQYTREVLERITDGFYALDRDWRFTYVNQTAERMLGRIREELQGQIIWEEFGPAEETPVYAAFHRAMADGITTSVDSYDAPLGAWFELRAYPSPNGLSIFFQDVTARRQLERQLRTSETKYRTLVEQIPAVVYVLAADQHQSPLYFSPRYQELTGFLPDEALLRTEHWLDHVHPEDRARVAANDALTLRTGGPFRMEYRHLRRDGGFIWVQDECTAIRDEAGQVIAWQGVLLDITERKAAEAALAHERDLLRVLMDSYHDAIYFKDEAGRFTPVNRAAALLYGLDDPAAAVGKTDFDFYPEEQARGFWEDERQVLEDGRPLVNRLERQSGEGDAARWTLATKVPLIDQSDGVSGLVGISRDITDVVRTQEALHRSEARFRSLIANATDLITILTADGTVLYESPPTSSSRLWPRRAGGQQRVRPRPPRRPGYHVGSVRRSPGRSSVGANGRVSVSAQGRFVALAGVDWHQSAGRLRRGRIRCQLARYHRTEAGRRSAACSTGGGSGGDANQEPVSCHDEPRTAHPVASRPRLCRSAPR